MDAIAATLPPLKDRDATARVFPEFTVDARPERWLTPVPPPGYRTSRHTRYVIEERAFGTARAPDQGADGSHWTLESDNND
jgi:hypothetical protein